MHSIILLFGTTLWANVLFYGPLFERRAYLDPGSGSYILQILIGALLGAAFVIKVYWRKIKSFFGRPFGGRKEDQTDDQ